MRISQIEFTGFRGLNTGKVTFTKHCVLLGANNVGKTAIAEAVALVFGRDRVVPQISDWDFFGGQPHPASRFTILCTVTDFSSNEPKDHPNWFIGSTGATPVWWHEHNGTVSHETDCPLDGMLAAQVALAGRYDEEDCEFETKRYFYAGEADPFTTNCDTVSLKRLDELGVFVIPSNRQWDKLMSFASSTFVKALRQSGAIPGPAIERVKAELRQPQAVIDDADGFKEILSLAEKELRALTLLDNDRHLAFRTTSLDTAGVLQNLLPHIRDKENKLLPLARNGAGMVSLQSFLVILAIAERRKAANKNFILVAEEPELHLHPSLHRRLASRIRAVSSQAIVTTHSPLVAAAYKPSESILIRNDGGSLVGERLRNESLDKVLPNVVSKLYLEKREIFYEAILGAGVIIPEGQYDFEWLHLFQRVVDSSGCLINAAPLSVVPTQNGGLLPTYRETLRFNPNVLPLIDGDEQGELYMSLLCAEPRRPKAVAMLGKDAATECLVAWVLEPCVESPGPVLRELIPSVGQRNLRGLQKLLIGEKKNAELHEQLAWEAIDNNLCMQRAAEFFEDLSDILAGGQVKRVGWVKEIRPDGVAVFRAQHVRKS